MRLAVALVLLLAWTSAVRAGAVTWQSPEAVPFSGYRDPRFRPVDDLLASFLAEHRLPGAAVAITRKGRLVYARGCGFANASTRRIVRPCDSFRIASISKPITAVAVLQLVEQGRLSLDARAFELLGHRIPRDSQLARVTVRQLLQHTAGFDRKASFDPMFRSAEIAKSIGTRHPATAEDVIRFMLDRPLDFEPGERYAYSNFGYCVLGRIVEQVTGRPYEHAVRQAVFRPLGIDSARIGRTARWRRGRGEVVYHTADDASGPSVFQSSLGAPVPQPYGAWSLEAMDAHGGWVLSAPDLVRFAASLDEPHCSRPLKPSSIETMFACPEVVWRDDSGKPKDVYYSCGWMVRSKGERGRNTWHTGSLPGTSSLLVRRHDGWNWAVLFNSRDTPSGDEPATLIDPLVHEAIDKVAASTLAAEHAPGSRDLTVRD